MQDTWPKEEHWINDATIDARGSCGLVVHRIPSNIRAIKAEVITAHINAWAMYPAVGSRFNRSDLMCFIMHTDGLHPSALSRIERL